MKRRFALFVAVVLALSASARAQTPGCVGGRLIDPRALFFALIQRFDPALEPPAPGSYVDAMRAIRPTLNGVNIHIQNEARGDFRPRLFLPTPSGDPFERPVDVRNLENPAAPKWDWVDRNPGAGYVAAPCDSASPPPPPPPPPPPELEARVKALEDLAVSLDARIKALVEQLGRVDRSTSAILVEHDTRLKDVEAKPILTRCEARINVGARIPVSCRLLP